MFVQCLGKYLNENSGYDKKEKQEEERHTAKKRRKTNRYGGFIIDEAQVDDEVEDNEEWEEGAEEIEENENQYSLTARDIERRRKDFSKLISKILSKIS